MCGGVAELCDTGIIKPSGPKYCMCWFMELDDAPMTQWAMARAAASNDNEAIGPKILAALPTKPAQDLIKVDF